MSESGQASLGIMILVFCAIFGLGGLIGLGVWIWRRSKREPVLLTEPLDVGAVISGMVAPFGSGDLPLIMLAIVAVGIPQFVSALLMRGVVVTPGQPLSPEMTAMFFKMLGLSSLIGLVSLIFYIAGIRLLVLRQSGRAADLREALGRVPALALPLIGMGILLMLGCTIGGLFLMWPAVLLVLTWSVAMPALVVEDIGVIASLRRSHALTVGSRGRILLGYLLLGVMTMVLFGIMSQIQRATGPGSIGSVIAQTVVGIAVAILNVGFFSTLYVKLIEIHGGPGHGNLADIFA